MQHNHTAMNTAETGGFFSNLLESYVPRQQCMYHQTELIALHVISDFFIALAYFSIPVALVYFARRRKDLAYHWMFLLFALFIVLCGTTHIFGIIAMWNAVYRLDGVIKFATALASIGTAIVLWRLLPHALALPSLREITKRKEELESLVSQRTIALTEINRALRDERDRAEAASQAKTNFLANMSHEIRTPMNAIVGLTELLQKNDVPADKQKDFFNTMQNSASQLLGLINDLLDISKIENRTLELDSTPFSLDDVVADVIALHSLQATNKGINVTHTRKCDGLVFQGDPLRLKQVLTNIVGNAVKFTDSGHITIETNCRPQTKGLTDIDIKICDTGIGIAPEKHGQIFNQFYQADDSITRKYGGTGLGLSISKTLIEMMGGTITVHSTEGKGSCFTVALRLPQSDAQPAPLTTAPEAASTKGVSGQNLILVVEDNPANTLVATTMLEAMGYASIAVSNGTDALALLDSQPFSLVLMDIQMPGMDGYAVTRRIRKAERETGKKRLPIIGVTAHALVSDREKCLDAGMDDYLSKPFRMEELKDAMERQLSSK